MHAYQTRFLEAALAVEALKFGEFTLKSGRVSPYFFNAGAFADGASLAVMAHSYAAVVAEMLAAGVQIDVLFGPAYKGIPLVAATAMMLHEHHGINLPWAFNRKEAKTHGEGGEMVGSAVSGRKVLILDDVLTAGTAVRDSLRLLQAQGAQAVGLLVALDRQEKTADSDRSALAQLAEDCALPGRAIVSLDDLLAFVAADARYHAVLPQLEKYRRTYGSAP